MKTDIINSIKKALQECKAFFISRSAAQGTQNFFTPIETKASLL